MEEYIRRNTTRGVIHTSKLHAIVKKYNRPYFITMHAPHTIRVQFMVVPVPEVEKKPEPVPDVKIRVYKPRTKK